MSQRMNAFGGIRTLDTQWRMTPNSRPEMVCQEFFAIGAIEVSNGEPRRLRALR